MMLRKEITKEEIDAKLSEMKTEFNKIKALVCRNNGLKTSNSP